MMRTWLKLWRKKTFAAGEVEGANEIPQAANRVVGGVGTTRRVALCALGEKCELL